MYKAAYAPYTLKFITPGGTSRGVLKTKDTFFVEVIDTNTGKRGIGECPLFKGLSIDDRPEYLGKLSQLVSDLESGIDLTTIYEEYIQWPSIIFGAEMVYKSLISHHDFELFQNAFSSGKKGIRINGLIWMGEADFMKNQLTKKLASGFTCIKLKIGALNFDEEFKILQSLRDTANPDQLEIRVDANGAYSFDEAREVLKQLKTLSIHSIEQPIKQGNVTEMASLCRENILPIALDEELIGVFDYDDKVSLIKEVMPQYIILKPALVGGFKGSDEWISIAEKHGTGWWVTSALESNIGLNAIAQYVAEKQSSMPQGLGTGQLFSNNIQSPLEVLGEELWYRDAAWNTDQIQFDR